MGKILVKTSGPFMLMDGRQEISYDRPCVVSTTNFVQSRLAIKQLVLASPVTLKDEATDEEFRNYWTESEGDEELAVSSFLSKYGDEAKAAKKSEPDEGAETPASRSDESPGSDSFTSGSTRRGRRSTREE